MNVFTEHVGNRVFIARDKTISVQLPVQHIQLTFRFHSNGYCRRLIYCISVQLSSAD
ncbi:hypothetical protein FEMY_18780 [Ferrovum myxofaciens]|uniref:Uncharacterized protein n=1 Tax=Ferrovum myxofaciens TaxID=416213 RepID=A0A149VWJ8_9PROT|nr:hypothetical protein FEMY_18780 [Ferrovum myxofaciens]